MIAKTLIHEMIHAEMYRQLLSISKSDKINKNKIKEYVKKNKQNELFNAYVDSITDGSDYQHDLMAKKYVEISVEFLREMYKDKYTEVEYRTAVWRNFMKIHINKNYWTWEK